MDIFGSLFPSPGYSLGNSLLIIVITVWTVFWKGLALWNAAQNNQKNWFIALIIINTVGILEIVYLFRFAKKKFTVNTVLEIIKNSQNLTFKKT